MAGYDRYVVKDRRTGQIVAHPPAGRRETAYESLERSGVPIRTTCRGSTICGLCVVWVEDPPGGLPPPGEDEKRLLLREGNVEPNARLACQLRLPPGRDHLVISLVPRDGWVREGL